MSALQAMIGGFITAAELCVLLFVSPVSAAEQPRSEPAASPPAFSNPREAHLLSSSLDVRMLGSLADVRVSQHFRNDHAETINLAGRLPSVDEHTEALRVHRRGRTVDLLEPESECGGEGNDGGGSEADVREADVSEADDAEVLRAVGHVRLALDESIADALQLAPGESASIELSATLPLSRVGMTYRITLPAHAGVESQALLVDQTDGRFLAHFLVVVPHGTARGMARLTLRPDRGVVETFELGVLGEPSIAYVIPIANRAALQALAAGAIELETRTHDGVVWSTLATHVRTDSSLALAGTAK